MLEFVTQKTGLDFTIERSMMPLLISLSVSLLLLLGLIYKFFQHTEFFLQKLRSKRLWMSISWLFYGLSVSGMVFCIIRDPPPFNVERSGRIQFFHPGGRQQFVVEGLIIGGCNVVAALSVILLTQRAPKIANPSLRMSVMMFAMTCFFFTYRFVVRSYAFKNQWYSSYSWL